MTLKLPGLTALALILSTTACTSMEPIESRSTCHTSDGQFVNAPGCTISYSSSRTTTTTTVTTVETNAPAAGDESKPETP